MSIDLNVSSERLIDGGFAIIDALRGLREVFLGRFAFSPSVFAISSKEALCTSDESRANFLAILFANENVLTGFGAPKW